MKIIFTPARAVYIFSLITFFFFLPGCRQTDPTIIPLSENKDTEENEMYDGPEQAAKQEFEQTKDPATGKVPRERLLSAIQQTIDSKNANASAIGGLSWIERGPNSDVTGPSNGNTRANSGVTSGRMRAIMVDSTDATHKTVWVGGVDGGLWKTTDITASPASWALINDNLSNLAIAAICQDPRPGFQNIMYFCTGESYYNSDAVQGNGVFKSTDGGATWTWLASTSTYVNCTRILCDYLGNIYLATRGTGLLRSTVASGGAAWTNITPTGLVSDICDLEISSTSAAGRLHVVAGIFSTQAYRYTDIPVTVAAGTWTTPAVAFPSFAMRTEICCSGNTLYALVADASYQVPTIYKTVDGGANWAATAAQPTAGWASGQGWYALACDIDPSSAGATCIVGGLDTWKTSNGGTSWSQISTWVGTTPVNQYVHADVHKILFFDWGNKLVFGCDGGIHYSADKGATIRDRNVGLRLKQLYSVAIHPVTTNYFLAGAQDNGTHQLSNAGLSSSVEVTGGDGAFVGIDQDQPQYQFGAYVYSNYRRSTNSGANWSSINYNNNGNFINQWEYDNTGNMIYGSYLAGQYFRWNDPQTGTSANAISIPSFNAAQVSAVCVSPFTANRVYFGTEGGRIVKVDAANTATPTDVNLTQAGMPAGNVACVTTGTDDLNMMLCYSNYGVSNIWVTTNGGTSWTAIDGNLPDMPVRWCLFYPGNNTKAYIATETGVWETDLINGGATVWNANPTFPTVQTDMIRYRSSDRTIAAATHGRGIWTTTIPTVATPDLSFQYAAASATESNTFTSGCRTYTDYKQFMVISNTPTGAATVTLAVAGGGTATQGVDYAVTTNGNFAAPSMTLNFPTGSGTAQPFTIRVYNDDAVEAAESFTLNYTTTGGNAQAGATNQTMVFTINDNDVAPSTATPISTALNSTKTSYLGPNDDVYFYDASGNIMARIKNLTAFDYGCTQVIIDRAGSTSAQFWNNTPANYLTSKSFKVIPTNNTAAGNYQISLYYTAAEVTGWQTATGLTFGATQVVKVSGGFYIPDVTPATPHGTNVSYVPGTAAAFGANWSETGTFSSTGFSGFAVGTPGFALAATLTNFNGYQKDKYGVLEWKTSAEYNNKGFELEKSYDGINFTKIAFVPGAGTSALPHSYLYNDKIKLTNIQYYRLKQIDIDGRFLYSTTVVLKLNDRDKLDLLSVTNPFFTSVNMMFSKPLAGMLFIQLFDMNGRRLYTTTKMPGNTSIVELGIPPVFIPGSYILKVDVDGQQFSKVILKQ